VTARRPLEPGSILIDATPLQSEHRLRGVGAYLRYLIEAIERSCEERPHYLVSTVGRKLVDGFLPEERTHAVFRPHRPAQVYWMYNEVALRWGLVQTKPGVFLAPDFNGLVRMPGTKTVAVLHDLTEAKLSAGRTGPVSSPSVMLSDLRWRAYYAKLRRADAIIAISQSTKDDAVRLLTIPPDRVSVVHHGVDHQRFRLSVGEGTYANHPPYFVHIGGRNENKNQARLLESFARIAPEYPDVHLYFAGPWRESDHAWLDQQRERLGLGARVRHLGYVPDADLSSLYGNSVAFVFPSLEEGFGLPVLEAMASGAPVITSNRSSLPEVAGQAGLLVDPLDVVAIAHALSRLCDEPSAAAASCRARGISRSGGFLWEATAAATLSVLRRVVAPNAGTASEEFGA
jgi:glycosyltransferase involved in cell wall biosynthesis